MKRKKNVYKENPYLVLFDAAEELGVFEFFEKKSREGFFPIDEIYKECNIPEEYKGEEYKGENCPRKPRCLFRDTGTGKTPCEDFYNKNYPPIRCPFKERSQKTFYFLMICLSSEMEFFEKKGRYFRKNYEGETEQSKEYKILESGVYNHIFDLKNFLDFSKSVDYFLAFKDELIARPHKESRPSHSDNLFLNKDAIPDYLKGIAAIALGQLPEFLSITDFSKCRTLLDIGPGPCVYSRGIFKKLRNLHPDKSIEIFGLDSQAVGAWLDSPDYQAFLKETLAPLNIDEFKGKFTFVPIVPGSGAGECKKDALFSDKTWNQELLKNRQFDAILIQNVLCHNSKRHAKRLITKCYEKLNIGGKIKIQDYFKDISESEPFASVVLSLYFRSISFAGQTFNDFKLSHMLFECGFRNIKQLKVSTFSSIIEAEKTFPTAKEDVLKRFWRYMFIKYYTKSKGKTLGNNAQPLEKRQTVPSVGEMLDYDTIYSVDFISLFKKTILEHKKDIQEVKEMKSAGKPTGSNRQKTKNYVEIFLEEDIAEIRKKDIFADLITYIGQEISYCIRKLKLCFEETSGDTSTGSQVSSNDIEESKEDANVNDPEEDKIKNCWKLLFHLNLLDKEVISGYDHDKKARVIKEKIFPEHKDFLIKLIQRKKCPDHLVIFFLLVLLKEFPDHTVEEITEGVKYIAALEDPYFVVRQLQKYFGPDQEACKFNLLNCIVETDKREAPSGFIYLWTLRWFLEYEIVNRDEFEYLLLVEEFAESKHDFIKDEVERLRLVLDVDREPVLDQKRGNTHE